ADPRVLRAVRTRRFGSRRSERGEAARAQGSTGHEALCRLGTRYAAKAWDSAQAMSVPASRSFVMAALVPAIHVFVVWKLKFVDARHKAGHYDGGVLVVLQVRDESHENRRRQIQKRAYRGAEGSCHTADL